MPNTVQLHATVLDLPTEDGVETVVLVAPTEILLTVDAEAPAPNDEPRRSPSDNHKG